MENVKDISFDDSGNPTITLNDGTVTSYVPVTAAAPAPSQTVTLAAGETLLVTVSA
jgi:hypothetical protein